MLPVNLAPENNRGTPIFALEFLKLDIASAIDPSYLLAVNLGGRRSITGGDPRTSDTAGGNLAFCRYV